MKKNDGDLGCFLYILFSTWFGHVLSWAFGWYGFVAPWRISSMNPFQLICTSLAVMVTLAAMVNFGRSALQKEPRDVAREK